MAGSKLKNEFNYDIPSEKTGEMWPINAHENGSPTFINGRFQGLSLDEFWEQQRDLFGNQKGDVFLLLTNVLDAQEDLSVQVHPNDEYALENKGELGKAER